MSFNLLHFKNLPILEQLKIEEALLRCDTRNFCIINEGSTPAVVLGISGKVDELVDREMAVKSSLPLIRRFSGGGTVVVDGSTLFVTFICQKEQHLFPIFPEPILKWSEELYQEVFANPLFKLKENDYALGDKKCGGNAQYLKKERWLHHTSFLWDYCPILMGHLLHPKKTPSYRAGRSHAEFLCTLKEFLPTRDHFLTSLKTALQKRYGLTELSPSEIAPILQLPHRQTTQLLT
ncbi:MAG: lipoate--protein ligase family protein [Chlamydiales bacterium]|nr:lipoate--protein ligase family protein [Chlamydiales bacterium]